MLRNKIKNSGHWRLVLVIVSTALMILAIAIMLRSMPERFDNGRIDISEADVKGNQWLALTGQWAFYYDQLLTSEDFASTLPPEKDALIKVPSSWADRKATNKDFPNHGVATYRLILNYPDSLKDPALNIRTITTAYRVYVNGDLLASAGNVSKQSEQFIEGTGIHIIDLPTQQRDVELLIQVANLNYAKGGLRESPIFGSKQVLEQNRMTLLALQLIFIGSVMLFGVYYFLVFILQTKNKTALLFSLLCWITGLRSLIWGELPILIFYPDCDYGTLAYINYVTGYNLIPMMLLFVVSLYPEDFKRTTLGLILLPTLFYNGLLLTSPEFMSYFTSYLYIVILIQMTYMLGIMIKAVLNRRENAVLLFGAIWFYVLSVNQDVLHFNGIGGIDTSVTFLYGKIGVIIAMSFVQARIQANTHKKLQLFNASLLEADLLKDKILATELSFLQAQIKPHFLYNALNAIANVCEKDGSKASQLIMDLAVYLRGSLEFNHLDKLVVLEKELEFVETYFHIEQARFGDKIQLVIQGDCPLTLQLPILMLQPLVENAVRHGISKKSSGGTVVIRMTQTASGTQFDIMDDGVGMAPEKLEGLLNDDRPEAGVGLLNIHHRLQRLYGSGLDISSDTGSGTRVTFVVPEPDPETGPTRIQQSPHGQDNEREVRRHT